MNLKIELSAHVYAAHRGLENESLVDVIDTQIPVTSNQCDSRLQLIPDTSECLSGEIRVDAKAAHVEPAGKKNARRKTRYSSGADYRVNPVLASFDIHERQDAWLKSEMSLHVPKACASQQINVTSFHLQDAISN